LTRRRLLLAGGAAAGLLVAGSAVARAQVAPPGMKVTVIGRSQGGQPLIVYHLGEGKKRVLVIGGQHGAPESNAVDVVDATLDYIAKDDRLIPKGVGLDVMTVANPDG
jgi:hypothetical protein